MSAFETAVMRVRTSLRSVAFAIVIAVLLLCPAALSAQATDTVTLRGHTQSVRLYGQRGNPPVIVSSGDGGWIHLAPHVAEALAARGFFVVGFDAKAYLASFTSGAATVRPDEEPRDFAVLVAYAARGSRDKPILIGVSEGAGLSVLAATDPATRAGILGVVGLGLPNLNELGWRLRDSLIYITHGSPNEPAFSTQAIVDRVAPVPLAAIHSTHDEFVPLTEVQAVLARAREPKRLWVVDAANHGFTDKLAELDLRLLEAIAWIRSSARH